MADYQLQSSKFYKQIEFSSSGFIAPLKGHKLYGESSIRVAVENVLTNNSVVVEAKLPGATQWEEIGTINGASSKVINVNAYDYVRFKTLRYSSVNGNQPKLIASGFFDNGIDISKLENKIEINSNILKEMLCLHEKMLEEFKKFNFYQSIITDEEI